MTRKNITALERLEKAFSIDLRHGLASAISKKDPLFFENDYFHTMHRALGIKPTKISPLLLAALEIKRTYLQNMIIFDGCDASKYVSCCRDFCDTHDHNRLGPIKLLELLRSNLPDA